MASAGETWVKSYDEARMAADEIMAKVQERNELLRQGQDAEAARVTSAVRRKISGLNSKLEQLQSMLQGPDARDTTEKEASRRKDLLSALRGRADGMGALLRRPGANDRLELMGPPPAAAAARETDATAELDNAGIVMLQRRAMAEQDEALEGMSKAVGATKHIALAVNDELGLQARLLDDLDGEVGQTQGRLALATTRLKQVMKKAGDWRCACGAAAAIAALVLVLLLAFKVIPTRW